MFQSVGWSTATVPVMLAQVYGFRYAMLVFWKYISGYFLLTNVQVGGLVAYTAALLMASAAQIIIIALDYNIIVDRTPDVVHGDGIPVMDTVDIFNSRVAVLYTMAISLSVFCGAIVLVHHGKEMASTRGFSDPLPLSRTKDGWTVSRFGRTQNSVLLGSIRVAQSQIASVLIKSRDILLSSTINASNDSTYDQHKSKIEAKPIGYISYHQDTPGHQEKNRRSGATGVESKHEIELSPLST